MRKIFITLLIISTTIHAQVKGNKQIVTKNLKTKNLRAIKVNLYADITIDPSLEEGITIKMDSNLFDKIDTEVVDGKLNLDQLEWIQPSEKIIITMGAPNLESVETGTHEILKIINLDANSLKVRALIGKVILNGQIENLNLGVENGTIDASELTAQNLNANIWGWGKAIVNAQNEIDSKIKKDGRLELVSIPKYLKGDSKRALARNKQEKEKEIKWISFKIKNNSWNRNNFFVIGPRGDGGKFSYGFPMMPGKVKKEKWSIGTKIYKVNKVGFRKLLVEIGPEDEGQIVKLFEKRKS